MCLLSFKRIREKDKVLCAKFRKGHFEGVIDVMSRLTKLINPSKIYMGEKDQQQLILVKKYIEKNYKVKIISCKTVRNKNKLALSSRNILLNNSDLKKAEKIIKNLFLFKKKLTKKEDLKKLIFNKKKELSKNYNVNIEYLELRNKKNLKISNKRKDSNLFVAYYINKIRLIDNF